MRVWAVAVLVVFSVGCETSSVVVTHDPGDVSDDVYLDPPDGKADGSLIPGSVAAVARSSCSTDVVGGLSQQIVDQINCDMPGTLRKFEEGKGIVLEAEVMPYLDAAAVEALGRAAAQVAGGITLTSGYRTVAQQYLIYRWDVNGRCGITMAAKPGASNHESGRAIDVSNHAAARKALKAEGWSQPFPRSDPVHFDFTSAPSLEGEDVRAFQKLWNRNHPEDRIDVDGVYGTAVAERLKRAPAAGFPIGPDC